ncbi:MAG: hypothetical protein ACFE8E_03195 [Candidatus Hodarchaeota archaeon]
MNLHDLKQEMPEIFEKVKKDVRNVLGLHRAGLSLGLVELGMFRDGFIGGMHFYPGTEIVMNKSPLRIILETHSYEIVWAYTYHILLHEYIHSLGIIDEFQCRIITIKVTEEIFQDFDHPALIIAKNGIGTFIPKLKLLYIPPEKKPDDILIEYVYGFDKESQTYFS